MVEYEEAQVPSFDFISHCESNDSANQQGARRNSYQTIKRFAPIHATFCVISSGKTHQIAR